MKKIIYLIGLILILLMPVVIGADGDTYYFTTTPIEIENTLFILLIDFIGLFLLWFFAEWRNDAIYYLFAGIYALVSGVSMLSIENLNFLIGTVVILLSVYLFYGFLGTTLNKLGGKNEKD